LPIVNSRCRFDVKANQFFGKTSCRLTGKRPFWSLISGQSLA
jgi:hypothetical protein